MLQATHQHEFCFFYSKGNQWVNRILVKLLCVQWHNNPSTLQCIAKRTFTIYIMCSSNCTISLSLGILSSLHQMHTHKHEDAHSEEFGHISKDSFCMSWSTVERRGPYSCLEQNMPAPDSVPNGPRACMHRRTQSGKTILRNLLKTWLIINA